MDTDLVQEIESWLIDERRWVRAAEICQRFNVGERALRSIGEKPGILSHCAISGDRGFKHVKHATPLEWERFERRIRGHGIAELVRVKRLRLLRKELKDPRKPLPVEKGTNQTVMTF